MPGQKITVALKQLCRSLADYEEAQDNGLLGAPVGKESLFALALDKRTSVGCSLPDMAKIVRQSALIHTGRASVSI